VSIVLRPHPSFMGAVASCYPQDGERDLGSELLAIRSRLEGIKGFVDVRQVQESGDISYVVMVDHYDPNLTYAVAKQMAGTGLYYHVELAQH
jgi:hypothetical protein